MMKKISLVFLGIAATACSLQAQSVKEQLVFDQQDRALLTSSNLREEGTPLLTTTWLKGLVKFTNGTTYKADFLKYDLEKDQYIYIPVKALHRIENIGIDLLEFTETQIGDYLGEDDFGRI
jgi:hypothetical protein